MAALDSTALGDVAAGPGRAPDWHRTVAGHQPGRVPGPVVHAGGGGAGAGGAVSHVARGVGAVGTGHPGGAWWSAAVLAACAAAVILAAVILCGQW